MTKKLTDLMGNLYCASLVLCLVYRAVFYTVKVHSLTWSFVWGPLHPLFVRRGLYIVTRFVNQYFYLMMAETDSPNM
jgi:hypothetical protein